MTLKASRILYLPKILYRYRQREGSIMSERSSSHREDIFEVCRSVLSFFEKEGKRKEYEKELEFLFIEHLLRTAALRFAPVKGENERFRRLSVTVEEHFPNWRKNPYLMKKSCAFRTVVALSARNLKFPLALLAKWKG